MWPLIVGAGLIFLLRKVLSQNKRGRKRLFISFAIEDESYRSHLVNQARDARSPFEFVDMSVKHPWSEEEWKIKCRTKIKGCDGMIVLLSKNTWHSSGARWEIKCAKEENIPVIGMHIKKNDKGTIPPELRGSKVIKWSWDNLAEVIKNVGR